MTTATATATAGEARRGDDESRDNNGNGYVQGGGGRGMGNCGGGGGNGDGGGDTGDDENGGGDNDNDGIDDNDDGGDDKDDDVSDDDHNGGDGGGDCDTATAVVGIDRQVNNQLKAAIDTGRGRPRGGGRGYGQRRHWFILVSFFYFAFCKEMWLVNNAVCPEKFCFPPKEQDPVFTRRVIGRPGREKSALLAKRGAQSAPEQ